MSANALIVVDVQQNMFVGPWPVANATHLRLRVESAIAEARHHGDVIVHVQNDGPEGDIDEPFSPGWELLFPAVDGDIVVRKTVQNTFESNPELAAQLKSRGVDHLVIVGVQSEMCLQATALGALDAGFRVTVPRALHGTYNEWDLNGAEPGTGRTAEQISDEVQADLEAAGVQFGAVGH